MELWYTERQTDAVGLTLRVRRTLVSERTPFQHLAVLDTEQFGRVLVLDGMVQATEGDEFIYHEMICHVALHTHPSPRTVAVIGGGDGGAVREVLKHASVEKVVLVEIDSQVIEASRRYLPQVSLALSDPRVEIRVEDGLRHVKDSKETYDVVIVDSTEPVGAAVGLFSHEFYMDIFDSLREDGIVVAQTESPFYNKDLIKRCTAAMARLFPVTRLFLASIPTYPSGLWSFTLGSKEHDPLAVPAERCADIDTRYYTPDVHRAAFSLPRFVQELVG
ncbi:MAG: polyamine aminopropyltransferase [Limnochordia bacterium]|jgi:spermidine synthase